ncbi:MAG: hypothetical protein L6437_01225 [Kiritimatiellae bacterium]|nr:hypothetical protein [Kiritimatiellia bacterium]
MKNKIVFTVWAGLLAMGMVQTACSAEYVWNATKPGKWNETANWQPGGIPGASDKVVFNGTSTNNCLIDAPVTVAEIAVDKSFQGVIEQKKNVKVSGNFKVEGEAARWKSSGQVELEVGGDFTALGKGSASIAVLKMTGAGKIIVTGAGIRVLYCGFSGNTTKMEGVDVFWISSIYVGNGALDLSGIKNYVRVCAAESTVNVEKGGCIRGSLYLTPMRVMRLGGNLPGCGIVLGEGVAVKLTADVLMDGKVYINTHPGVTNSVFDTCNHALTVAGDLSVGKSVTFKCGASAIKVDSDVKLDPGSMLDAGTSQWQVRGQFVKNGQVAAGSATIRFGDAPASPLAKYQSLVERICGERPGQEDRVVIEPWPDKILYLPGETAKFAVSVSNATQGVVKGRLKLRVMWEMDEGKDLGETELEIKPGEKRVIEKEWQNVPDVLGCEVRAELVAQDGKSVATGSEYFNVCPRMEMMRVGIHAVSIGLSTVSDQSFLDKIPGMVAARRAGYVNIGELFAAGKSSVFSMTPEEDEYPGGDYWQSKTALRLATSEMRKCGMKSVVYVTSYSTHGLDDLEVPRRHPEWVGYEANGQPSASINVTREDQLRKGGKDENFNQKGCFVSAPGNWMNQECLDNHIQELIGNKKMFGLDGVRYDGEPGSQWAAYDIAGKPQPKGDEARRERVRLVRYIRERVRKELPDYLFMFNAGKAVGSEKPVDLVNGVLDPGVQANVENGGAFCDEEVRGAYSTYNSCHEWKKYADLMVSDVDLTRKAGGFAYVLFPWTSTVNVACDELGYSILLAAGDHPWFASPGRDYGSNSKGGPHYPVQKELFAFATRFSAMLWGRGIDRVRNPETMVEVKSGKGEIWWKNFVHQRTLANGRKLLIVHLLNAPPTKFIEPDNQDLPEPMEGVEVKFKAPVKKVWLASPHPLMYGEVECRDGVVKVPLLNVWSMLIAELK